MADMPIEKKFKILCDITRATHFAWREAALELCPQVKPQDFVNKFWEITGRETAKGYLKRLDPNKPVARQVADAMVWSSVTMGEDAELVEGKNDKESYVRHKACPWVEWHRRLGLLEEDQPGCDKWFEITIKEVNKKLGTNVKFETEKSLPAGGECCLRRIWVD